MVDRKNTSGDFGGFIYVLLNNIDGLDGTLLRFVSIWITEVINSLVKITFLILQTRTSSLLSCGYHFWKLERSWLQFHFWKV